MNNLLEKEALDRVMNKKIDIDTLSRSEQGLPPHSFHV